MNNIVDWEMMGDGNVVNNTGQSRRASRRMSTSKPLKSRDSYGTLNSLGGHQSGNQQRRTSVANSRVANFSPDDMVVSDISAATLAAMNGRRKSTRVTIPTTNGSCDRFIHMVNFDGDSNSKLPRRSSGSRSDDDLFERRRSTHRPSRVEDVSSRSHDDILFERRDNQQRKIDLSSRSHDNLVFLESKGGKGNLRRNSKSGISSSRSNDSLNLVESKGTRRRNSVFESKTLRKSGSSTDDPFLLTGTPGRNPAFEAKGKSRRNSTYHSNNKDIAGRKSGRSNSPDNLMLVKETNRRNSGYESIGNSRRSGSSSMRNSGNSLTSQGDDNEAARVQALISQIQSVIGNPSRVTQLKGGSMPKLDEKLSLSSHESTYSDLIEVNLDQKRSDDYKRETSRSDDYKRKSSRSSRTSVSSISEFVDIGDINRSTQMPRVLHRAPSVKVQSNNRPSKGNNWDLIRKDIEQKKVLEVMVANANQNKRKSSQPSLPSLAEITPMPQQAPSKKNPKDLPGIENLDISDKVLNKNIGRSYGTKGVKNIRRLDNKKVVVILGMLLLLLGVAIGGYFMFSPAENDDDGKADEDAAVVVVAHTNDTNATSSFNTTIYINETTIVLPPVDIEARCSASNLPGSLSACLLTCLPSACCYPNFTGESCSDNDRCSLYRPHCDVFYDSWESSTEGALRDVTDDMIKMCTTKVEAGSSQPSLPNYPTRKRLRGRDARDFLNSTNVNAFVPNQKCQQYCVPAKCCDAAVIENPSFSGLVLSPLGVYTNAISGEHVITNCQSSNAKNTMVCSKYRQLCSNDKDTVEATPNELFSSKDTDAEAVEEVESISMPAASILSDSPASSPLDSPSAIPAATILTGSPTRPSDSTSASGNQTIDTVLVGNQSMEAGDSYLTSYVDVQNIQDSCASDRSTFLIQTGDEPARAKCIQACFEGLCCFTNGLGVKNLTKSCYIGNEHQCSQYAPCLILRETLYTDANNLTITDAVNGTIAVVNNTELDVDLTASTINMTVAIDIDNNTSFGSNTSNPTGTPNETADNILISGSTSNDGVGTINVQELDSVDSGT